MPTNSPKRVLITGGSGMIGTRIAQSLSDNGVEAVALSRSTHQTPPFTATFFWNPTTGAFDPKAFDGVDTIIHLAGAGIADKRWTEQRKHEIIESRVRSTQLLAAKLNEIPNNVRSVVAASAVGYYGNSGDERVDETTPPGDDFLAITCVQWEQALRTLETKERRLAIIRIGIVLDAQGGALPVMARPVKLFTGAPYGNGKQYVSWIDSSDLVRIFLFAASHATVSGIYNAVAPEPVTNNQFVKHLGQVLHRPVWPIAVPGFVFKLLLGEQAAMVLGGQQVSCEKLVSAGFQFEFPDVMRSLQHQLKP
jgi:uncharacterized protein (TIGR01777 family)